MVAVGGRVSEGNDVVERQPVRTRFEETISKLRAYVFFRYARFEKRKHGGQSFFRDGLSFLYGRKLLLRLTHAQSVQLVADGFEFETLQLFFERLMCRDAHHPVFETDHTRIA